ncbi:MAG: gamma-glutamylcyclotransferase [Cyanobacteria bacterium P01_A01_bin.83]
MKLDSSILDVFVYGTLKPGYANHGAYCEGKITSSTPAYSY